MATNKIAMKFRSITYPNHDNPTHSKRGKLQRMQSFDFSHGETCTTTTRPSSSSTRREVSAEGRLRTRHFQHTHSASHSYSSNTLAPGQKLLRFSDECWCTPPPPIDHGGRQARSVGCLTSPKSRPGSAIRLGGGVGTAERLVDWQRGEGGGGGGGGGGCFDRHSLSPSHSYERHPTTTTTSRQSRSRERRLDKDYYNSSSSSSGDRRSHFFSSSVSLLQSSKSSSVDVTSSSTSPTTTITTPTTPPVSAEGRSRRSQFRRAWSLFSLTCDKEVEKGGDQQQQRREKSPQQRILRPPTRHVYRRGLSGLPIECSSRYLGLAY